MDPELTLAKAKTLTCQKEAIREQQLMLESTTEAQEDPISLIQASPCKTPIFHIVYEMWERPPSAPPMPHQRRAVPQMQVQGTFAVQCCSKSVAEVGNIRLPEEDYDDVVYLNTLGSQDANYWTCAIQVNGQYVSFKVDTGDEDASRALDWTHFSHQPKRSTDWTTALSKW